jgi:hypothetical protein
MGFSVRVPNCCSYVPNRKGTEAADAVRCRHVFRKTNRMTLYDVLSLLLGSLLGTATALAVSLLWQSCASGAAKPVMKEDWGSSRQL